MTKGIKLNLTFEEAHMIVKALDLLENSGRLGPDGNHIAVWNLSRKIESKVLEVEPGRAHRDLQ